MDFFNHTRKLFAAGEVNTANLKVILVNASYTFAAANATLTEVSANEVSGNGWAAGGAAIASASITVEGAGAKLNGDDISVTASGGDIGSASAMVVVDATSSKPLFHFGFASAKTAGDGTPFNINWDASGIVTWTSV